MSPKNKLMNGDALLVVDMQNDFCPGGALPIDQGDKCVPVLNEWIEAAQLKNLPIYLSRDWHPIGHMSFKVSGGKWPEHCLQDSKGAAFHSGLKVPDDAIKVTKGTRFDKDQNSAFDDTGLLQDCQRTGVRRLWIGGLALDVCVLATALDGKKAGFDVHLIKSATRPVTIEGGQQAIEDMRRAGIIIEDD